VKAALYDKNYAKAFGSEEYRFAYALRWVPSRAVIYRRIFKEIGGGRTLQRALMGSAAAAAEAQEKGETVVRKAIMLGGGAGSEVIGLALFWASRRRIYGLQERLRFSRWIRATGQRS
jgi:25S rRNA (uracil2843-N3)-methyltransferase